MNPRARGESDSFLHDVDEGGDIVIRDAALLKDLAKRVRQPLEIVEAGLKEYRFNTAAARVFLDGPSVGIAVQMDGEKGKRDLEVRLHDWL